MLSLLTTTINHHVHYYSIAFLSFGLGMPESLTTATGSSLAVYGIIQFVVYLKYPEFFDGFI